MKNKNTIFFKLRGKIMKNKTLLEDKNTIFINVTKTKHIEEDYDDEVESIKINKNSIDDILKIIHVMQEADMCSFEVDDVVEQLKFKKRKNHEK